MMENSDLKDFSSRTMLFQSWFCHSERSEESLRGFAPTALRGAVGWPESRGSGGPKDGLRR